MHLAGILTGPQVQEELRQGRIQISPFDSKYVNPGSVDLTLGTGVAIYKGTYTDVGPILGTPHTTQDGRFFQSVTCPVFDSKERWLVDRFEMDPKQGWVLKPGICYLMHTAEVVHTRHYVPVLDGKSSIGRMFVKVHETAGYGDSGFNGQYTLEVTAQIPVRVYPGMRFCQIRFTTMVGEPLLYSEKGHYQGSSARGAVETQAYRQFDDRLPSGE